MPTHEKRIRNNPKAEMMRRIRVGICPKCPRPANTTSRGTLYCDEDSDTPLCCCENCWCDAYLKCSTISDPTWKGIGSAVNVCKDCPLRGAG